MYRGIGQLKWIFPDSWNLTIKVLKSLFPLIIFYENDPKTWNWISTSKTNRLSGMKDISSLKQLENNTKNMKTKTFRHWTQGRGRHNP